VVALQYLLVAHGRHLTVDGQFGPQTRGEVIAFQRASGLSTDGIVGEHTWGKLIVTVRRGQNGAAVEAVQSLLAHQYGANIAVDGAFGPATDAAVRSFQRAHGLSVDGIVGRQTWFALLTGSGSAGGGSGAPAPPGGSAQSLAREILANGRIAKSGRLVLTDLQDAAAGRPATAGRPLSATLLRLIVALGRSHSLSITALESGGTGHAPNSYHYTGDAVDIGSLDGQIVTGRNAPALTIIATLAPLMPAGSAFGQSTCGRTPALPSGITTFPDTCNHLHIQVPRNAP
jgi:peptidoglycan hydrolase-like protein with peptidoglycan-binding domain